MLKKLTARIFVLIFLAALAAGPQDNQAGQAAARKTYFDGGVRVRIISSSHQDIAWMDSPQKCIEYRDKQCITPALELMAKNPEYCFVMENMLNLMEYIERHPDRKADILRYAKDGRLEWGATFNQPYESLLSGEQLVRQTYFGRKWIKKNFPGCDATVYFNPDVPGRALQMQQILSKSGIPYMVISRYHEGFYRWLSPDGSSVLAYSPGHYGNSASMLNAKPSEGRQAIVDKLGQWGEYYRTRGIPPEFPLLNSVDFSRPTDFGGLINLWNGVAKAGSRGPASLIQYSSARQFSRRSPKTTRPSTESWASGRIYGFISTVPPITGPSPPIAKQGHFSRRPRSSARSGRSSKAALRIIPGRPWNRHGWRRSIPTTAGAEKKARSRTGCFEKSMSSPATWAARC
jgi:hypothetical protein